MKVICWISVEQECYRALRWEEIFWAFRVSEVKVSFIFCIDNVRQLLVGGLARLPV